jgi:Na+-transporting methylmalonyl-CoA/oxaloacetate decarboxylase gamma subunit
MQSSKGSSNYWPGFVDALSNMVMVMIFVVLVLIIVCGYLAMQIVSQATSGQQQESSSNQTREERATLQKALKEATIAQQQTARLQAQLKAALQQNRVLAQIANAAKAPWGQAASASIVAGQSKVQSTLPGDAQVVNVGVTDATPSAGPLPPTIKGDQGEVVLTFQGVTTALADAAKSDLDRTLQPSATAHYEIVAEVASGDGYTMAQRQAYFRGLSVRNYLLGKGVSAQNVQLRVVNKVGGGPARVLIRPSRN